jgi:ParB family chromosome partitioning protein
MRDQHRREMLADAERGEIRAIDLLWIPLDQIVRTPEALNSRQDYPDADLDELTASIRTHGITSPILVRPIKRAEAKDYAVVIQGRPYVPSYVLMAGNRRFLAAKKAGLQALPALVRALEAEQAFLLNLTENIQRRNLSNAEIAPGPCKSSPTWPTTAESALVWLKSRNAFKSRLRQSPRGYGSGGVLRSGKHWRTIALIWVELWHSLHLRAKKLCQC